MAVAREVGGLDQEKVNKIRKLVSKSGGANAVEPYEPEYLAGAIERGVNVEEAHAVWAQCIAAGNYLFNMAHTYAYALVGYWTAYLKAHYPAEFTCAMARSFHGQEAERKRRKLFRDFYALGGRFKLLDYEYSEEEFIVFEGNRILGGFGDLRNWGPEAVRKVYQERRRYPFRSWDDFYARTPRSIGTPVRETSIHAGRLNTDAVLWVAPWYPEVTFTPEEEAAQATYRCVDINSVENVRLNGTVDGVPILGRLTAARMIDLVASARKYGGQVPLPGEPTIRVELTLNDPTGSIDVSFSARRWRELDGTRKFLKGLQDNKGIGNSLLVYLSFFEDRSRFYGEDIKLVRSWRPPYRAMLMTREDERAMQAQLPLLDEISVAAR